MTTEERKDLERELLEKGRIDKNARIDRPLYDEVYNRLKDAYQKTSNDKEHISSLLSVWGDGGVGKSGIVVEMKKKLKKDNITYQSINMDRMKLNNAVAVMDEIICELYKNKNNQAILTAYVLVSEYYHNNWDSENKTFFKDKANVFEQGADAFFKVIVSKIAEAIKTESLILSLLISLIKQFATSKYKEILKGLQMLSKTKDLDESFAIIAQGKDGAAKQVKDTFIRCINECLTQKPYVIIIDNAESIKDFSTGDQKILDQIYRNTRNIVWYYSGRDRFKPFAKDEDYLKKLNILYYPHEIEGISADEIIDLTLRKGILVDDQMITVDMAEDLRKQDDGNLLLITIKLEAILEEHETGRITKNEYYQTINSNTNEALKQLINTEFKNYEESGVVSLLLYGCLPHADYALLEDVNRKLFPGSPYIDSRPKWYLSGDRNNYVLSPAVAEVLQNYIQDALSKEDNRFIINFTDDVYKILLSICENDSRPANLRPTAEFISLYRSVDDCISLAEQYCQGEGGEFLCRAAACMGPYLKNTADYQIYKLFMSWDERRHLYFFTREQQIAYLKKTIKVLMLDKDLLCTDSEAAEKKRENLEKTIRDNIARITKLPATSQKLFKTPRIDNNIDLLGDCRAIRHRYDEDADRFIENISALLIIEMTCIRDLITLEYDSCKHQIALQKKEYERYSHGLDEAASDKIVLQNTLNYDTILDSESLFCVKCASVDPTMLKHAEQIQAKRIEQIRTIYDEGSLELAETYKECYEIFRMIGNEEKTDEMISRAFDIVSAGYIHHIEDDNENELMIKRVMPILDALVKWMGDSAWRSSFHAIIAPKILSVLKDKKTNYTHVVSLCIGLLHSYEKNGKYVPAMQLINEIITIDKQIEYKPKDRRAQYNEENEALDAYLNSNPFFIEEIYRNYRFIEKSNAEDFSIFNNAATHYLNHYQDKYYQKPDKGNRQNPKYNFYKQYYELNKYYAKLNGTFIGNPHTKISMLDKAFKTIAHYNFKAINAVRSRKDLSPDKINKLEKGIRSWYGIERDQERALFSFLLETVLKNKVISGEKYDVNETKESVFGKIKPGSVKEADIYDKNNSDKVRYYDDLRKLWLVDFILITHDLLSFVDGENRESLTEDILNSVSWKSYIPSESEKRMSSTAYQDMYYDQQYDAFMLTTIDVSSTLKHFAATSFPRNGKEGTTDLASAFVFLYLDMFSEYRRQSLPFFFYHRYKAMLIEMLFKSGYATNERSMDAYISYYRNERKESRHNEAFWRDYFDIYTDLIMLSSEYEKAICVLEELDEKDIRISYSLNRRLSLLYLQRGDRPEALEKMEKCLELLEKILQEQDSYSNAYVNTYINYLYVIRPLFDDRKSALAYYKEKKRSIEKNYPDAFQVIYSIENIIQDML